MALRAGRGVTAGVWCREFWRRVTAEVSVGLRVGGASCRRGCVAVGFRGREGSRGGGKERGAILFLLSLEKVKV
ncbi:MAG: hypothetical protein GX589_02225 [Deltaproteobacteria bacterium]|nr:hypothetical protein [Deltaproteobacteria bacterium]